MSNREEIRQIRQLLPQTIVSKLVTNYKHAVQDVRTQARWLRDEIESAERRPSSAHTPGRLTQNAGCLDAAREKASSLRETLEALGLYDPKFDDVDEKEKQQ